MMRALFLWLLLLTFFFAQGQKKSLTLEESVLNAYSTLAPERLQNPQWIPGEASLSYISSEGDKLMRRMVRQQVVAVLATVEQLNDGLNLQLNRFPYATWQDGQQFYFRNGQLFYRWDITEARGEKMLEIPEGAGVTDLKMPEKLLAYTLENNLYVWHPEKGTMAVTAHSSPDVVSGQAIARYEFGISKGTFWSPGGSYLAFYEKDESDVTDYPIVDIATTPAGLQNIKYPMAGQKSEYARVGIFNVKKKKTTYLQVPGPADQYLTNLAWGPDEKYVYITVVNRDQNHLWLQQYDVASGQLVRTLLEEEHSKYVEPEQPLWFVPGKPDEFLWFSERDGFNHLYRYNLQGTLLNQVTSGAWVVESILGYEAGSGSVIVSGWDETGLNKLVWRAGLENDRAEKMISEKGIHRVTLSADARYLLDQHSSLEIPYRASFKDPEGRQLVLLMESNDPLDAFELGQTELIQLAADDGTPLYARLIKPTDFNPQEKYPVLVYVYGGPHLQLINNDRLANASLWMHYMANQGYLVFSLDNRGSANRGLAFENVIHRRLGDVEIADQLKGVEYLRSQPWVDANRMAVHGWSFGGFMTSSLMLRHPGVFQVGVAGGPVTDWKYYEVMYGERYMDRPEENPEGYQKARLMEYAGNLKGDLLLIHGYVDDVVVLQHNLSLIREFVKVGKQVDFFVYPTHPHNVRGKDRVHLMEKVLNYITEKLD